MSTHTKSALLLILPYSLGIENVMKFTSWSYRLAKESLRKDYDASGNRMLSVLMLTVYHCQGSIYLFQLTSGTPIFGI